MTGCNSGGNYGILLCHTKAKRGWILGSGGICTNEGHLSEGKLLNKEAGEKKLNGVTELRQK